MFQDIKLSVVLLGICLLLMMIIGVMAIHLVTLDSIIDAQAAIIEAQRQADFLGTSDCGGSDATK